MDSTTGLLPRYRLIQQQQQQQHRARRPPPSAATAAAVSQPVAAHQPRRSFSAPATTLGSGHRNNRSPAPITYDYQIVMSSHRPTRFTEPLWPREKKPQLQRPQQQATAGTIRQRFRPLAVRGTKKSERQRQLQQQQQQQQQDTEAEEARVVRYTAPRLVETREAARRGTNSNHGNKVNSNNSKSNGVGNTDSSSSDSVKRYKFTEDFVPLRVYIVRPPPQELETPQTVTAAAGINKGIREGIKGARRRQPIPPTRAGSNVRR